MGLHVKNTRYESYYITEHQGELSSLNLKTKAGFLLHFAPNQREIVEEAKWFSCVSFWICGD